MSRLERTRFMLCLAAVLIVRAAVAAAAVPSPANCTVDHVIVGSYNFVGAASGTGPCVGNTPGFDVWVRDAGNAPVPGAVVSIVFAGTGTSIRPYRNPGPQPNVTIRCGMHEIDVVADANGHAVFVPRFGRWSESPVVPVYANGVFLTMIEARSADYNNDGTVDLSDLSMFAADYLDPFAVHRRSDFDDCPSSSLGDLSFFVLQYTASAVGPIEAVCP
jgi:hypothetical protein